MILIILIYKIEDSIEGGQLMNYKYKFVLSCYFIFFACAPQQVQQIANIIPVKEATNKQQVERGPAQKFMDMRALGKEITSNNDFNTFLDVLPEYFLEETSRVYLARIDDFPIGGPYSGLDKWDMALETGLIEGLIDNGLTIAEKLDHVSPRDPSEYMGTSPQDAFYMHGINLDDLKLIENDFKAPHLLTYQIMDFSEKDLSVAIYLRMIDLSSMKVLSSTLIKVGAIINSMAKESIDAYNETYNIVKNIFDFPSEIFDDGVTIGLMNADILNISGNYKNQPSRKTMSIENGIVSGLTQNEGYNQDAPVVMEKSKGFKLKFPSVYNNIVFNTNPILYEDWSEFVSETNCNILMMYRYIPDSGLYLKVIDTMDNGRILYSNAIPFRGTGFQGVIRTHKSISELLKSEIDPSFYSDKKIMLIDGDKQAVASDEYFNTQPSFNEMNLIVEEGMMSALVSSEVPLYEKLKTLYLKRPWMYDEKVFNLNPLYLDDWSQLKDFGIETLMVYNNLIPYEKFDQFHPENEKVAIGVRVVDVNTGDILRVIEITNLN